MRQSSKFTEQSYTELLELASEKYCFVDAKDLWLEDRATVLWRHDVDYSPQRALSLAKIEYDRDLQCVYHFMLSSRYYNVFEPDIVNIIKQIHDMGHFLGIHVDLDVFGENSFVPPEEVLNRISFEKKTLEGLLGLSLSSMSFHNYTLNTQRFVSEEYVAGLPNLSAPKWFNGLKYMSDSNGLWRYGDPFDILAAPAFPQLMVLTHPIWWTNESLPPFARLERAVKGRAQANLDFYLRILSRDGRLSKLADQIGIPVDMRTPFKD